MWVTHVGFRDVAQEEAEERSSTLMKRLAASEHQKEELDRRPACKRNNSPFDKARHCR